MDELMVMEPEIFKEFEEAIMLSWEIPLAKIEWQCPFCFHKQISDVPINPYRALAQNMPDEDCEECGEFVKLSLYERR